jgi:hypothetical protein
MMEVTEEKNRHFNDECRERLQQQGDGRMRAIGLSLAAAAALLASVGVAVADPVKLTDVQLDKATAGQTTDDTSYLLSVSTTELGNLLAISNWAIGGLNGVPQPLPTLSPSALILTP